MPSFARALKRDIDRLKFVQEQDKRARAPKSKKKLKPEDLGILKTRDVKVLIGQAAVDLRQVEITYRKQTTGEIKTYRVAPYSYRYRRLKVGVRKMFFAYDMVDRHIKGYVLKNIRKVDILRRGFKPKWPVEISIAMPMYVPV